MDDLLGLNAPEPLREYYSRSFYRATWIFTALDAGFWTAMSVKPKILRDILSLLFTLYYLVYTDRGIEKVRKVRALITIDHLRVSWNKGVDNPVLRFVRWMHSSQLTVHRTVTVLLETSGLEPVKCHVMYAGDPEAFAQCRSVVLNYPGGGFVCMGPESHSDYLSAWAEKTKAIVVSVDYAKAPEYPYPYAIDQCYELYRILVQTNGKCIGLDAAGSSSPLRIVMAGDSAGGNITASVMFRILESPDRLPHPQGIIFIYGNFNMDIRAWMTTDETRTLLGAPASVPLDSRASHESLTSLVGMRDHMHHISPLAVTNSDDGYHTQRNSKSRNRRGALGRRPVYLDDRVRVAPKQLPPKVGYVPLAMTSSFTYFNDRILSPEMMRAMIIMYIGPNRRPDFRADYYLSPLVAPDRLLEQFPPVYFMCGEKDPMVDDTVLFAARIRQAKQKHSRLSKDEASAQFYIGSTDVSEDEDPSGGGQQLPPSLRMSGIPQNRKRQYPNVIKVKLVAGMSHGFMQMYALLPESKRVANLLGDWLGELLDSNWHDSLEQDDELVPPAGHYGLEEVSTADMVHRRGHGLADPLS
ncbi:hypothetical protein IW140_005879 [Coemansia sp. RSA 1813]|nr:hypothetical protein EV178_005316 [Coemansia sp. RSA 1646]KAJ1766101.1 hypothetical protein LPJ74_006044 [Coemansia sp. RSA 1843]KAJ2086181.1 hypothetical protein IW138_005853 [Coemansia sp. RSA 986]KAJ2210914.1 hypothetical protein EV179_005903 [Coemansia sp. RSA 487]KAJ2564061.1 hypothetical protein IW140_005879 [Coemansia sp. RSA 1813]